MNFHAWRYRRFHVSYLIGWFSCGLLTGLVLAQRLSFSLDILLLLSIALIVAAAFRQRRWWSVAVIMLCGVLIGLDRGGGMIQQLMPYEGYVGQTVKMSGVISDDPQYGNRGEQQFRITLVEVGGELLPGEVFVSTYSILDVKRGDKVVLKGKLRDGFGNFQASLGFATLESATAANDPVREFRDRFAVGVRNIVEEPSASLGIGFVVGQRSALPEELDEQLRVVGLTHIVVASGYNLTILVRFARRILAKHSKYLATAVSVGLMIAFVAVSGLSPSMTRASLVTGLSLLAWYYGRRFHPLLLIFYTAAITAYINPVYIWSDLGWYLSFLAFAGVLIVAPLLVGWAFRRREPRALEQVVVETIAAQTMTLPLILSVFGQLPVLSVLSNALVAPVIPLAMLLTTVSGVAGMLWPAGLGIFGSVTEIVLRYIVAIVEWLASPGWAQIVVTISSPVMVGAYAIIIIMTVWLWRRLKYDFRSASVVD